MSHYCLLWLRYPPWRLLKSQLFVLCGLCLGVVSNTDDCVLELVF